MSATTRRLPGIRFDSQAPVATTMLPRMDVAAFVGFASSGPLHLPVAIEDAAQFADVFGPDAPLAWDPDQGAEATAQLGVAVRGFFRNGGTRCWVVRVADAAAAETAFVPVPGFVAISDAGTISPAMLPARSPGSAADGLFVSASIAAQPLRITLASAAGGPQSFTALVSSPADLEPGDLVRLTFTDSAWTLWLTVATLQPVLGRLDSAVAGPAGRVQRLAGTGGISCWTRVATVAPGSSGELRYGTATIAAHTGLSAAPVTGADVSLLTVSIPLLPDAAPPPGSVVEAQFGEQALWLEIAEVQGSADGGTTLLVTPLQLSLAPPDPAPAGSVAAYAERVTLELTVGDAQGNKWVIGGFGLGAGHASFAGALPSDADLYAEGAPPLPAGPVSIAGSAPRFPLAGPVQPPAAYLPLGASLLPGPALGAVVSGAPARARDGLAQFDAALFLDPDLAGTDPPTLLEQANWTQYASPSPRLLTGIHALLAIDEVTIVTVPDAIQRGWAAVPTVAPLPMSSPPAGGPAPSPSPPAAPPPFGFQDCGRLTVAAPQLLPALEPGGGIDTLSWTPTDVADAEYELQEASDAEFGDGTTLYAGPEQQFTIYGRPPGASRYYRVRVAAPSVSDWSATEHVLTGAPDRFVLDDLAAYSPAELERVQLGLLRMCAARGDLLAVLSLPEQYSDGDAISHVLDLKGGGTAAGQPPDPVFGFGAIYHPWLYCADSADPALILRTPPDGAAAGVIAARTLAHGAWVAPANVAFRGVVALDPPIGPAAYAELQAAQVNLVRQEPTGFLCLAADTLSDAEVLRPIGVRRLLQGLRRTALLHGASYAFEGNGDIVRRTVQRGFERILARMFALGAFAGATAAEAFVVTVLAPVDAGADGQLVIELQVAPSRPLSFITVRLVRSGGGGLQVVLS